MTIKPTHLLPIAACWMFASTAGATVALAPLFGSKMVLQRDKPCPVWGTATAGKVVTVSYNSQTKTATADAQGNWRLALDAMGTKASGSSMTVSEAGGNTVTLTDVVVGDVWICSGQSNMAFSLNGCNRQVDIDAANYPGIRHIWVPLATAANPQTAFSSNWSACSPSTAGGFSAVAFYFGRKIHTDQGSAIPIGLIASTVGGTCIDPWLVQEGLTDISVLAPLYSQSVLPWGPFSLANGMIHPLAPYACKGAIWYQGENRETTSQSNDSYFLKEKGLAQGWKRAFGLDDFALYVVLLANYGTANTSVTPDAVPGTTWADTRIQQTNVVGIPHAGVASAIDVGEAADIHPKDKLDVGERLALWALKNDYGRTSLVTSGPILKDVTISNNTLVCSFDYVGAGLMVGSKTPYLATTEVAGGVLTNFSIAGATGGWVAATATINADNTVTVSAPSITAPRKVAYACWQNPSGCNLYNRDGLPANPFYIDDATAKYTVTATAGANGSITPAGATTYLKRKTALYSITPDAGYSIQDVTVDGVSVGAVRYYTFDPLYANHTIAATFTAGVPNHTIACTATTGGGTVSPTGSVSVGQGNSQTFSITSNSGNLVAVTVDGQPMGQRNSFTFSDVRADHTLSVTFSCAINAQAGYGGTISPNGTTVVAYGSNQTYTIAPISGFAISKVTVDGANVGAVTSYTFTNVTGPHSITATFVGTGGAGSVPQQSQIIFSSLSDTLPANGAAISSWSTYIPSGQALTAMGSPTVETVDERKFVLNRAIDGDGFRFGGSNSSSIACTGASIVVVAKPTRYGTDSNWQSLVDVFYDRLVLGIMNGSGRVCVRRNGSIDYSTAIIPEGQTTILSLVVQSGGAYKVYANGTQVMNITSTSDMSALVPGVTGGAGGFGTYINVGRNNPDGWTTFNGDIGDVFLYKTALADADRVNLETYLVNRLAATTEPLAVTAWNSVATQGVTPRALSVPVDGFVEPRTAGIRRLEVSFGKAIAVSDPSAVVAVSGVNAAGNVSLAALGITVNASVANSTLALAFSNNEGPCALPDAAKWRFTLDPAKITGLDGSVLAASAATTRVLAGLAGDFDGDGRVTGVDLNEIDHAGPFDPAQPASLRADIDCDGVVGAADLTTAWANRAARVDQLVLP